MDRGRTTRALALLAVVCAPVVTRAQTPDELQRQLDAMKQQMQAMQEMLRKQESLIRSLQQTQQAATPPPAAAPKTAAAPAPAAPKTAAAPSGDAALDAALAEAQATAPPTTAMTLPGPAIAARQLGPATFRLVDVSFDVMVTGGWSTADNAELSALEAGGHDPNQRGFTLQQAELSLAGAVDPYFNGEAYIVFTPEGVELEEAFATTQALPWGLQVKAGQYLTAFGRINQQHPHQWDWLDVPVINSRLFGADGLRNPGSQVGWLMPVPWFSQLILGAQNATGETAYSFLGSPGEGDGLAGRPLVDDNVGSLADLLYLTRWENGLAFGDTWSGMVGGSALFGPNGTGPGARTTIYGGDLVLKWRPVDNFRGWPFVTFQTEAMQRTYDAAAVPAEGGNAALPAVTLHDWGLYSQLLYGFHYGWAAGLRYEFATGNGPTEGGSEGDALRDRRQRVSPLLTWMPTEYSRLRLQYNFDDAKHLANPANTVWLGLEIGFGQHPAHKY